MSDDLKVVEGNGLFGYVPESPAVIDPRALERRRERERREEEERAKMRERIERLPSKEELAVRLIDIADSLLPVDQRIKAMQLYAHLMGFLDSEAKKKKNSDGELPKIMPVPVASTDEEWQRQATKYAERLEKQISAG